ncbi:pyridoxal phosphate-dependent aminotransferase family protein [Flagellimonas sp. CMM7]|uniref:aminotransferase class I/II-fold pyridoxal phosphate-dependent enzyme n=1 Tax=Flagellimonas sp. CMM7 TaxID=2654676 RepID=UPI0013D3BE7F|nr:pyridoxal phosphate-dependent aminotransferase family protein [Flagellimonas sp. CMM7]UII78062.1 pyridoxal phosphate-dependent aminotransferase family protein [Flagellimonas sp. CMM7]
MERLPHKLQLKLSERLTNGSMRSLKKGGDLIDFSSNDYLGLAGKKMINEATTAILKERNLNENGATGSRLLTGNHILYKELEDFLALYHNSKTALVFNSGYDANIGFFSSVPQRGDIILYDELVHASIRDGIKMSNAKSYKFKHNDLKNLGEKISLSLRAQSRSKDSEIYIVTESVFSMDGDSPDIKALADFCAKNGCYLVIDEAHATGIFGDGKDLVCQLGLEEKVFARIITFGKALGSHGAVVLGSHDLKTYLVNFARSLIYTTALSPHTVASVLSAYQYLETSSSADRLELKENIKYFKEQIQFLNLNGGFIESNSAIHSLIIPRNERVKQVSKNLQSEGFDVKPILSPTVKAGQERLRFCLHSYNTKEEISRVLSITRNLIK